MSQPVHLEIVYPYPPERVWQVLTDRRALSKWMMENDFEPRLGHKFRFYNQPLPGLTATIQCEVVELEEPNRLVYTWQESATAEPSLVVWTLTPVADGTQLRLKHYQYSYTTAVATLNRSGVFGANRNSARATYSHQDFGLVFSEPSLSASGLAVVSGSSLRSDSSRSSSVMLQSNFLSGAIAAEFFKFDCAEWNYFLNQTLPVFLAQD